MAVLATLLTKTFIVLPLEVQGSLQMIAGEVGYLFHSKIKQLLFILALHIAVKPFVPFLLKFLVRLVISSRLNVKEQNDKKLKERQYN